MYQGKRTIDRQKETASPEKEIIDHGKKAADHDKETSYPGEKTSDLEIEGDLQQQTIDQGNEASDQGKTSPNQFTPEYKRRGTAASRESSTDAAP